ncbi:DNA-binding helix-turn-helix protein [Hoylesella oralis ATCC 33269]|uniref:DNA-binding helix-turn-helix protein n=1 Tax=Hoylesella oralis ATCC 33269 TaxID=873533 RepID=E7RP37_9BACT|nr:helix-turn-helix transcriptional regulator [Hoylesella oralis]EFZ37480.1 DNA-binding helix-turn-helix protein [Hoylesella oralis ATCC 33269]SHF89008.1 DNA-binding transcriptional regulator, XRE-family HTH domain [Hoylesella oralis]
MKDRIRQLMINQHMTQQSFADMLGISPASLSGIFTGRTNPTLNHVDAIKKKFPSINLDWLLYGHGAMFADDKTLEETETVDSNAAEPMIDFDTHSALSSSAPDVQAQKISNNVEKTIVKYLDKPQRKITEIRVFYDDQTWETFKP